MTAFRIVLVGSLLGLSLTGCGKKESPQAGTSASAATPTAPAAASATEGTVAADPAAKPFVPAHAVPAFTGKFPHRDHPYGAVADRAVELRFARKGGENDVAPLFSLKNLTNQKVRVNQTWLFYYDAQKQKSDRYPHSLGGSLELGPGESKEVRLGRDMKDIPKDLTVWEGEVTSAYVGDKRWDNENLNPMPRPAGGVTAAALAANAGERLIVDVYSLATYKVRLTNVTDQPVKDAQIALHYGDAKGENNVVRARIPTLSEPIAPGQSIDVVVEPWSDSNKHPPAKATQVAAYAPRVDFASGPSFNNENLDEDFIWPKK
jgi:hypothetical protein